MRSVEEIILAAGGATAIERASGGQIRRAAVYKWPLIGIRDRHWPILISLAGATADELLVANEAARLSAAGEASQGAGASGPAADRNDDAGPASFVREAAE